MHCNGSSDLCILHENFAITGGTICCSCNGGCCLKFFMCRFIMGVKVIAKKDSIHHLNKIQDMVVFINVVVLTTSLLKITSYIGCLIFCFNDGRI